MLALWVTVGGALLAGAGSARAQAASEGPLVVELNVVARSAEYELTGPDGAIAASGVCRGACEIAAGWWRGAGVYGFEGRVGEDRDYVEFELTGTEHAVGLSVGFQGAADIVAVRARIERVDPRVVGHLSTQLDSVEITNRSDTAVIVPEQDGFAHWAMRPLRPFRDAADRRAHTETTYGFCGNGSARRSIEAGEVARVSVHWLTRSRDPGRYVVWITLETPASGARVTIAYVLRFELDVTELPSGERVAREAGPDHESAR